MAKASLPTMPISRVWAGLRRLRPVAEGRARSLALLTAASVISGLAEAGVLLLLGNVAAAMVLRNPNAKFGSGLPNVRVGVGLALWIALGLGVVRLALQILIAWLPAKVSAEMQARIRRDLFAAFTHASWETQSRDREGDLQELMTDQVAQACLSAIYLANTLSAAAMFLVLLGSAFFLNGLVALVVLVTAVVLFAALRPIDRRGRKAAKDLSQSTLDHAAGVNEAVRLAEDVQVFGVGGAYRGKLERLILSAQNAYYRYQLTSRLVNGVYQSLVIVLIVAGLGGVYLIGAADLATLGAVVLMLVRASSYAQQFQSSNHILGQTLPYVERLERTTNRYRLSSPKDSQRPLPPIRTLRFREVGFSYHKGVRALEDVSFEVEAGEVVGIIGPTGAGKSTLSQLLLRLRSPDEGRYLINDADASSFSLADWQRQVAYVAQDPRLFDGTVADNIRFFRDVPDEKIRWAARQAHIHDEIVSMRAGYETVIGQRVDAVSGGQRQRICLARALAGQPDVLLLDEPTSALDMRSEILILNALAELHGQSTLFIVAHRLAILDICDRVLVLDEGRVASFAALEELKQSNPFYRQLLAHGNSA